MSRPSLVIVAPPNTEVVEDVFRHVVESVRERGVDIRRVQTLDSAPQDGTVVIAHTPVEALPGLQHARVLGQRIIDRAQRLALADRLEVRTAPWAHAGDAAAVDRLTAESPGGVLYKEVGSYKGKGVRPLGRGEEISNPRQGDVVMAILDEDPVTYKVHLFGGSLLGSHAYHSPPADQLPFSGRVHEYEWHHPDDELTEAATTIGRALLSYGGGYCGVDLMRQDDRWWVIEVNTGGVGLSSTWAGWPEHYARSYTGALLAWVDDGAPAPTIGEARERASRLAGGPGDAIGQVDVTAGGP